MCCTCIYYIHYFYGAGVHFNMVGFITRMTFTLGQLTINLIYKKGNNIFCFKVYIYNSKTFLNSSCEQNTNDITGCLSLFTFHSLRRNQYCIIILHLKATINHHI